MAAYAIFDVEITDPAAFGEYVQAVGPIFTRYGGKILSAAAPATTLEGEWRPAGLTILEFPSMEQARAWYDAPDYQAPKQLRQRAANCKAVLIDGLPAQAAP